MPLSVLRGKKPRWRRTDRLLAVALQLHEDSLCACGHPIEDWGTDKDAAVTTRTCPWCAALERHQKSEGEPSPGEKAWVVDDSLTDDDDKPVFAEAD